MTWTIHLAIASVEAMVKSPDFDHRMLLLAVQLAYESDLKTLLLSVLDVLLANVNSQDGGQFEVEALTLIRCMVRLRGAQKRPFLAQNCFSVACMQL